MTARLTLSDTLIEAAKSKIVELIEKNKEVLVLEKPYSNFRVVASKEEPKHSHYMFSLEEIPAGVDLKGKSIFIVAERII